MPHVRAGLAGVFWISMSKMLIPTDESPAEQVRTGVHQTGRTRLRISDESYAADCAIPVDVCFNVRGRRVPVGSKRSD